MAHDDRACEQGDDARQSQELTRQVGKIAIEKDEACLLDGVLVDGLVVLKEVAESKSTDSAKGHAKKEQIAEV